MQQPNVGRDAYPILSFCFTVFCIAAVIAFATLTVVYFSRRGSINVTRDR